MTVLHSGSNNRYSSNWSRAFSKGKSSVAASGSSAAGRALQGKKKGPAKKSAKRAKK